jgi:hypothetical protein
VILDADLAAYWAIVHRTAEKSAALSDSSLRAHGEFLGVDGWISPGTEILCIGVGTGRWIDELREAGCRCSALDICQEALNRVPVPGYLSPALLPRSVFDLIVSYWVAPHLPADALQAQMAGVIPALKTGGIFALHFCEPTGPDPRPAAPELHRMIDARSAFTREEISEMAARAGGRILSYSTTFPDPQRARNYCAVHIGRN